MHPGNHDIMFTKTSMRLLQTIVGLMVLGCRSYYVIEHHLFHYNGASLL